MFSLLTQFTQLETIPTEQQRYLLSGGLHVPGSSVRVK